ncbi:gamma-tubulin complex component 2 isoform X1 [Ixodes scapularis]
MHWFCLSPCEAVKGSLTDFNRLNPDFVHIMNRRSTPAARNEQAETGRRVAAEKKERQTATVDAAVHRRKLREDDRNRLAQGGDGGAIARAAKNLTSKEQKPGRETGTHQYDLGKQDLLKLKEEIEKTASVVQTRTSSTSSSSYHTAAERHSKSEPPASPGMPQLRMSSWDFGSDFAPVKPTQGGPIGALPVKAQEYRLIKDLLNCMIESGSADVEESCLVAGVSGSSLDFSPALPCRLLPGSTPGSAPTSALATRSTLGGVVFYCLVASLAHLVFSGMLSIAQCGCLGWGTRPLCALLNIANEEEECARDKGLKTRKYGKRSVRTEDIETIEAAVSVVHIC